MSIYVNKDTKLIVQGITGNQGGFHSKLMLEYGTNIVAGVTPGKAGKEVEGVPVYNTVVDALKEHEADWTAIFVPPKFIKGAAMEAIESNLNIVLITEGIPVHDSMAICQKAKEKGLAVIGPNCPGIISPGKCKIGIMPGHIFEQGRIGLISRSGTLTYEIINALSKEGLGQSTAIGIGGDPIIGTSFIDALEFFEKDTGTDAVVVVGEIGGSMEEETAKYIKEKFSKPVVAYIAGRTAPKGKKMGHAGAVISGNTGTAKSKIEAFKEAGVPVVDLPSEIATILKEKI